MQDSKDQGQDMRRLPIHFFGGFVVWVLQVLISYALAPTICESNNALFLILLTIVAAMVVIVAIFSSFRMLRNKGDDTRPTVLLLHHHGGVSTKTFINTSSIILNIFFLTLIIFTGISTVLVSPCPYITMQLP